MRQCNPGVVTFVCALIYFRSAYALFHNPHSVLSLTASRRYLATDSLSSTPPLKQFQILYDCDAIDSDTISEFFFELGSLSVSCEVQSEKYILNDESKWSDLIKTKSWKTALLRAHFPSSFDSDSVLAVVRSTFPDIVFDAELTSVEDKDWVAHVQSSWNPIVIGDLTIRFPWHTDQPTQTKYELVLEGGAAFGTGDHPTTRLCSRWIEANVMHGDPSEKEILDYGCGSAILGLVGLKYGARRACGVDIDKDSLDSAKRNCELNNLNVELFLANDDDVNTSEEKSFSMNTFRGSLSQESFPPVEKLKNQMFDLTVANILAPILIFLAPNLAAYTKPYGKIALSGLVIDQAEIVMESYRPYFDNVIVEEQEDGWALVTGTRKGL